MAIPAGYIALIYGDGADLHNGAPMLVPGALTVAGQIHGVTAGTATTGATAAADRNIEASKGVRNQSGRPFCLARGLLLGGHDADTPEKRSAPCSRASRVERVWLIRSAEGWARLSRVRQPSARLAALGM